MVTLYIYDWVHGLWLNYNYFVTHDTILGTWCIWFRANRDQVKGFTISHILRGDTSRIFSAIKVGLLSVFLIGTEEGCFCGYYASKYCPIISIEIQLIIASFLQFGIVYYFDIFVCFLDNMCHLCWNWLVLVHCNVLCGFLSCVDLFILGGHNRWFIDCLEMLNYFCFPWSCQKSAIFLFGRNHKIEFYSPIIGFIFSSQRVSIISYFICVCLEPIFFW